MIRRRGKNRKFPFFFILFLVCTFDMTGKWAAGKGNNATKPPFQRSRGGMKIGGLCVRLVHSVINIDFPLGGLSVMDVEMGAGIEGFSDSPPSHLNLGRNAFWNARINMEKR